MVALSHENRAHQWLARSANRTHEHARRAQVLEHAQLDQRGVVGRIREALGRVHQVAHALPVGELDGRSGRHALARATHRLVRERVECALGTRRLETRNVNVSHTIAVEQRR